MTDATTIELRPLEFTALHRASLAHLIEQLQQNKDDDECGPVEATFITAACISIIALLGSHDRLAGKPITELNTEFDLQAAQLVVTESMDQMCKGILDVKYLNIEGIDIAEQGEKP